MSRWLKWILVVLAVLAALIGATAALGSFIDPGHVASRSAFYRQPPEIVWGVISDFEKAPSWREGLQRVERGADINGHPVWVEHSDYGPMPLEVTEMDPPKRMVTRVADEKLAFGGTWVYELAPEGDGCRLTITEHGTIHNPLFRFMARFIFGYYGSLEDYLRALGRKFGEEVSPA